MQVRIAIPLLALALAGCRATHRQHADIDELEQQLVPLFTNAEVQELDALEPQLPARFRLGIAPPLEVAARRDLPWSVPDYGAPKEPRARFGTWSEADEERLSSWCARFRELGWIDEAVFLPSALVNDAGDAPEDLLLGLRKAGVRNHVDAVLVTQTISSTSGSANLLALLDLTLVGAFIVPGYDLRAGIVVEGLLIDTRNEYLYAAARGAEERTGGSQATRIDERADKLLADARAKALDELAQGLLDQGTRAALAPPRKPGGSTAAP